MAPLLVVLPFCRKDIAAATRLLNWIHELEQLSRYLRMVDEPYVHSCLLVADSEIDKDARDKLRENAARSFRHVSSFAVAVPAVGFAPNHMFLSAAKQIQYGYKLPWLWLEPDCVPLKATWLDQLADAYAACPKKFMGPLIHSTQPGLPAVHLTGCSIYSPDAFEDVFNKVESLKGQNVAWDIECAALATPRSQHTDLIQHVYGEAGWPPTFVMYKEPGTAYAKNVVDVNFLSPKAVLFHRVKDESLMNMLRIKFQADKPVRNVKTVAECFAGPLETIPSPEPAKRKPGRPRKNPELAPATA